MVRTLNDFIAAAARQLKGDGWTIARCRHEAGIAWHVTARKGKRWLVVQVVAPGTAPETRREAKLQLGYAAQLPAKSGRMEQWLAHVRPDGHVTFSHDTLSGSAWATDESDQQVRERLRLDVGRREWDAPAAPAPMDAPVPSREVVG